MLQLRKRSATRSPLVSYPFHSFILFFSSTSGVGLEGKLFLLLLSFCLSVLSQEHCTLQKIESKEEQVLL